MAGDRILLTANQPVAIAGQNGIQLANPDQVYTWDASQSQYGPVDNLDRLVTHDTTGLGDFDLVFHTDGSPMWH